MDASIELERIIAIYFNGENYVVDGVELSRDDSKIIAYQLIHSLQMIELILAKKT